MKTSTFKATLDSAKNFLADQDFIAILQHFAFDEDTVIAYNDAAACKLKFTTGLKCTVPGMLLIKVLNTLNTEEFELVDKQEQNQVVLKSGRSNVKLPRLPFEDFVFKMPEITEKAIPLHPSIIDGLRRCLNSVSNNPTKPEFTGVTFIIKQKSITLYASNGLSISRFILNENFPLKLTEEVHVILPKFFCEQLVNLHSVYVGKDCEAPMQISAKWAMVELGNNSIFTRVIEHKPPKFEEAFNLYCPKLEDMVLWDIPVELEAVVERAVLFLDPKENVTTSTITVKENEISIKTASSIGVSHDTIELTENAGNFTLQVDPTLLLKAFKICKRMTIQPKVIILENDNYVQLIATK